MANTYLPPELTEEVSLENANFVSNDQLRELLAGTDATESQVEEFVRINEDARLAALRAGLLVLAGISELAVVTSARLPSYRTGEIPDPAPAEPEE